LPRGINIARLRDAPPNGVGRSVGLNPHQYNHRTALILFAVAVIITIFAAFITTLERIDTRTASNETPPGTAKPHLPLDRAPSQPVLCN
jgi:hypothetical protein